MWGSNALSLSLFLNLAPRSKPLFLSPFLSPVQAATLASVGLGLLVAFQEKLVRR